jgi:hypothetical protein
MDDDLVAVVILPRGTDHRLNGRVSDFSNALEYVTDLAPLQLALVRVLDVLVLATCALHIIRTSRINAMRGERDHPHKVGGSVSAFDLDDLHFDPLAFDDEGHEHHEVIHASDPITAKRHRGDVEFEALTGL